MSALALSVRDLGKSFGGVHAVRDVSFEIPESALTALVCMPPGSERWRERARQLRWLVEDHAARELAEVSLALATADAGVSARLAGAFATERLRQLAMLQPSAPFYVAELAAS